MNADVHINPDANNDIHAKINVGALNNTSFDILGKIINSLGQSKNLPNQRVPAQNIFNKLIVTIKGALKSYDNTYSHKKEKK